MSGEEFKVRENSRMDKEAYSDAERTTMATESHEGG